LQRTQFNRINDGRILVCERSKLGKITDRSLIHKDCNNEFRHMELGEDIKIWLSQRREGPLHAPAALLLYRQIVAGQEDGEPLPLGRGVDVRPDEMAGRQRHAPVSQ